MAVRTDWVVQTCWGRVDDKHMESREWKKKMKTSEGNHWPDNDYIPRSESSPSTSSIIHPRLCFCRAEWSIGWMDHPTQLFTQSRPRLITVIRQIPNQTTNHSKTKKKWTNQTKEKLQAHQSNIYPSAIHLNFPFFFK